MLQFCYLVHEGKEKVLPKDKIDKLVGANLVKKFDGKLNDYRGNRIVSPIYSFQDGKSWSDAQDILLTKSK